MPDTQIPTRYHDLIRSLMHARGVTNDDDIQRFVRPDFVRDTHDPFLFADMSRAVERIIAARATDEKIAVYADFDCDGIPGAALMSDFFHKIGHPNLEVYIPHRHDEGHGFHVDAVRTLHKKGVTLIITVDVGISAHAAAQAASELGIDVIITDHHELPQELPPAVAVINPRRAPYPFPHLCGAATAFKLVTAVLHEGRKRDSTWVRDIPDGWEKWLLDLVAIATVGDMVPLLGENRALVRFGLMVARKSPRPGLVALCKKLRIDQRVLSEEDIAFSIAPRVNAASRMDSPEAAFGLLAARDTEGVEERVQHLEKLNNARKGAVASLVKEVRHRVEERGLADNAVVVLGDPSWKPALLGLAGTNIVETYGKPVCLWGRSGSGVLKGSCRSNGAVSIAHLLAQSASVLIEYGGHAGSGGFAIAPEHVHRLSDELCAHCADVPQKSHVDVMSDATLDLTDVTDDLLKALAVLSPFGMGNPAPTFRFPSVSIRTVRLFGKGQEHTELLMEDREGRMVRGIRFFATPETFVTPPSAGSVVSIAGVVERDAFNQSVRIRIMDVS